MQQKQIFRQAALDRLSSPEQLDQLIQVLSPKGWITLTGLGVILVGFIIWGFLGKIPTNVLGEGLVMERKGVARVSVIGNGYISEFYVGEGDVVKEGQLIAKIADSDLEEQYRAAKALVREFEAQRDLWPALQLEIRHQQGNMLTNPQELLSLQQRIHEAESNVTILEKRLQDATEVRTKSRGRVLELMKLIGDYVSIGQPIISIELGGNLSAEIFFPERGRNIRVGSTVQVVPSTVKREEYGALLGKVAHVSEYPSTEQGMMYLLENEQVVRRISNDMGGYVFYVRVELLKDSTTKSGYKWTSKKGANVTIAGGTFCTATDTLEERSPISLVIPLLRKWTGI